jgi:hypothetical protein
MTVRSIQQSIVKHGNGWVKRRIKVGQEGGIKKKLFIIYADIIRASKHKC